VDLAKADQNVRGWFPAGMGMEEWAHCCCCSDQAAEDAKSRFADMLAQKIWMEAIKNVH